MTPTEAECRAATDITRDSFIAVLAHLPEALRNYRRNHELRQYAERYAALSNRQKAGRILRDMKATQVDPTLDIDGTLAFIIAVHGGIPSVDTIRAILAD